MQEKKTISVKRKTRLAHSKAARRAGATTTNQKLAAKRMLERLGL